MTEKEGMDKKIMHLLVKAAVESVKEDDVKLSPLFMEASSKLEVAERDNRKLKDELQSAMDRQVVAKGDLG